jgi:hypothetical protein
MMLIKPYVITKSFILFYPIMLDEKLCGQYDNWMKAMNVEINNVSIERGRDGVAPIAAVQACSMVRYVSNIGRNKSC